MRRFACSVGRRRLSLLRTAAEDVKTEHLAARSAVPCQHVLPLVGVMPNSTAMRSRVRLRRHVSGRVISNRMPPTRPRNVCQVARYSGQHSSKSAARQNPAWRPSNDAMGMWRRHRGMMAGDIAHPGVWPLWCVPHKGRKALARSIASTAMASGPDPFRRRLGSLWRSRWHRALLASSARRWLFLAKRSTASVPCWLHRGQRADVACRPLGHCITFPCRCSAPRHPERERHEFARDEPKRSPRRRYERTIEFYRGTGLIGVPPGGRFAKTHPEQATVCGCTGKSRRARR
jgi:hypothetical protein